MGPSAQPIPDIGGSPVVDVLMGQLFTFLKTAAGVWYGVGNNAEGELALGFYSARVTCRPWPVVTCSLSTVLTPPPRGGGGG